MSLDTAQYDDHLLTTKLRSACLVALLVTSAACALAAVVAPDVFWLGYLPAAVFWLGAPLGGLSIVFIHRLTGGRWGWEPARTLHALVGTIPIGVLGVLPLGIAASFIYPWANSGASSVALTPHQQIYLAPKFVLGRTGFELLAWLGMGVWLISGYLRMVRERSRPQSPVGAALLLIVLFLTATSVSVDGLMSLTPAWTSSVFGALWAVGFALEGLSLLILLRHAAMVRSTALGNPPTDDMRHVTHDLGKLLLAFNLMWAYLAFSQYLIMWSGDLPREVSWYAVRSRGWPAIAAISLIVFHFALPLVMLLSREQKRDSRRLIQVAVLLLAMHVCDIAWTVMPAYRHSGMLVPLTFIASWCAIGSAWLIAFDRIWMRLPEPSLRRATSEQPHSTLQTDNLSP